MHWDMTVTLGNVLTILTTVSGLGVLAWRLFSELQRMKWKLDLIWRWYAKEHGLEGSDNSKDH
jgi:hypothetical protein